MHASGCPTREQIAAYLLGTLRAEEADELARHVENCPNCASIAETLKQLSGDSGDYARRATPSDRDLQKPGPGEALTETSDIAGDPAHDTGASPEETKADKKDLGQLADYKLLEELGRGGMGTVYKALHCRLGREVALKVLPSGRMTDARAVARFEREMKAVGRLDHPNIVRATDAGEVRGTQFLVMELLQGFDLGELVDRCGRLRTADACELVRQAALGLQCACEHGLVHRDVKPSNLMLTRDRQVKLLDLGLARFQVDQPAGDEMTATGQPMGTADYMAPEQVSDTHSVDIRADIYSLGCTFYKLLAGQPPYGGPEFKSTFDKMMAHRQAPIPPIGQFRSDLPGRLVAILDRMLAKEPAARFATPAEVAEALGPLAAGCDLAGLLDQAQRGPEEPARAQVPLAPTDDMATAPFSATRPSRGSGAMPSATSPLRRWKPWGVAVGLIVVIAGLGLAYRMGTRSLDPDRGAREVVSHDPGESPRDQGADPAVTSPPQQPPEQPPIEEPPEQPPEQPPPEEPPQQPPQQPPAEEPPQQPPQQPPAEEPPQQPPQQPPAEEPPQQPPQQPPAEEPPQQPPQQPPAEEPPQQPPQQPPAEEPPQQPPQQPPTEEPPPAPKSLARQIEPEPLRLSPAAPLGRMAMVARPAAIEGVRSWTIETRSHRGPVYQAAYRPDGRVLATAGGDGVIRLWNPHEGQVVRVLVGHDGPVRSLSWAPDGSALASGSEDRTIRLWDLESGLVLRTLRGHSGRVNSVAWSEDGRTLASAGADGPVRLWDPVTGEMRGTLRKHSGEVYAACWSPDGSMLASCGEDKAVCLWEASSAKLLRSLTKHEGPVRGVAWSSDGKRVAAAVETPQVTGAVMLWSVESGESLRSLPGHRHGNSSLAWSRGGELLAAGGALFDNSVRVWAVEAGNLVFTRDKPSGIHPAFTIAFSPDGMVLAGGGDRGRVQLWDALSGEPMGELPAHAASVAWAAFSPDEATLACGYHDGTVRVWQTGSGELVRRLSPDLGAVRRVAWSPDGKMLATAYFANGLVDVWNVESGEKVTQLQGIKDKIESIAWSPDAKSIAIGGTQAQRWDIEPGKPPANLPGQGNVLAFSPDGSTMAVGMGGDVRIADTTGGKVQRALHGPRARLRAVAFSPDGQLLAAGCDDKKVYVWEIESGRVQATSTEYQAPVIWLVWRDDGMSLVSGSEAEVCVWQPRSGKLVERIAVDGGALAPAGGLVASRGASMIRLARREDGKPLRSMVALSGQAYLALEPDGHYRGSAGVEEEILYVVQTGGTQETLAPEEFADKYEWQNDPGRVELGSQ